jgi:hypothetical protein
MGSEDSEQLLEDARFKHLSETTLISYKNDQLDEMALALADAHLNLCLVCERRLDFLKAEAAALASYEPGESDRASIEDLIKKYEKPSEHSFTELDRLNSHVKDLKTAWLIPCGQETVRGPDDDDELWRYESEDGSLLAIAMSDHRGNVTIRFSSTELAWEGFRILLKLGQFRKEVTLEQQATEVFAKIVIPFREYPSKLSDVSIEALSPS